tara:strand:- start:4277 stop:5932 length:1656 start_codon:yes stop_codon:yes gene_type:complete
MVKFVNRVKLNLTTTGTGTVTFGSVVDGFQSLADASVVDSDVVRYTIESGTNFEVGTGTIGLAGGTYTMARAPSSSSLANNSAINLNAGAVCFLTMLSEDIVQVLSDLDNVSSTAPAGGQNLSYDSGTSSWVPASPSGGITSVANLAGLPASPNETDLAWVQDTKSLFIYDGTEWDRFYTDTNATPDWTTPPPSTKQILAVDGTATVQTVAASDPEGFPIEYTFDTNPASPAQATVSNSSGVFTITPSTSVSDEGEFTLRYRASDGIHSNALSTVYVLSFYTNPDMTSVSYDSKSFDFSPPENNPYSVRFSADGTKMYCVGYYTDTVYQFTLSTAFDVSTSSNYVASGAGATPKFYVGSQEGTVRALDFSADGTKMYICGGATKKVHEYDLSTAFDVSTSAYNNNFFSVSGQMGSSISDVKFSATGHRMYVTGYSVDKIVQYDLSTNFDVTSAVYNGVFLNTASAASPTSPYPQGIAWNNTGSKLYHCDNYRDTVYEWDLTTEFDVSTATQVAAANIGNSYEAVSMAFSSDGTKMYILNGSTDTVHQFTAQ